MDYQGVVDVLTSMMGVSAPLVIICALAGRVFNAFVSMVTGKERIKL